MRFLHAVSRWQLVAEDIIRDPLDPFFGEPTGYQLIAPARGELVLHPSRMVRFFGNPLADPLLYAGLGAAEALALIAAARGLEVPDTDEQRRWVMTFERLRRPGGAAERV